VGPWLARKSAFGHGNPGSAAYTPAWTGWFTAFSRRFLDARVAAAIGEGATLRLEMRSRSPARFLAPGALVVAAVVVVLVVRAAGGTGTSAQPSPGATAAPANVHAPARFYTVRSGDILSRVAERTDVSVGRILVLNPHLDPNALRPGQRLRLRP
jgi:LysM repeat protein